MLLFTDTKKVITLRRDELWHEKHLNGGGGDFCRTLGNRGRIWNVEELGVNALPGLLGVSIDGVL